MCAAPRSNQIKHTRFHQTRQISHSSLPGDANKLSTGSGLFHKYDPKERFGNERVARNGPMWLTQFLGSQTAWQFPGIPHLKEDVSDKPAEQGIMPDELLYRTSFSRQFLLHRADEHPQHHTSVHCVTVGAMSCTVNDYHIPVSDWLTIPTMVHIPCIATIPYAIGDSCIQQRLEVTRNHHPGNTVPLLTLPACEDRA